MTRATKRAAVIVAHPCDDSLTTAAANAAGGGLVAAGFDVTTIDLYAIGFDAVMSLAELDDYRNARPPSDPLVAEHARLVQSVDILVFVYPTWWSGLPAILKGWLERVLVPGVAFDLDGDGKITGRLRNVDHIVGISTYGSPWGYVKLVNDNGRRTLTRALRMLCGRRTATTWLGLYSLDTKGPADRTAFLDRIHHTTSKLS